MFETILLLKGRVEQEQGLMSAFVQRTWIGTLQTILNAYPFCNAVFDGWNRLKGIKEITKSLFFLCSRTRLTHHRGTEGLETTNAW